MKFYVVFIVSLIFGVTVSKRPTWVYWGSAIILFSFLDLSVLDYTGSSTSCVYSSSSSINRLDLLMVCLSSLLLLIEKLEMWWTSPSFHSGSFPSLSLYINFAFICLTLFFFGTFWLTCLSMTILFYLFYILQDMMSGDTSDIDSSLLLTKKLFIIIIEIFFDFDS